MGGNCSNESVSRSAGWRGGDRIRAPQSSHHVWGASSAKPCAFPCACITSCPQVHMAGPAVCPFLEVRRPRLGERCASARVAPRASGRAGPDADLRSQPCSQAPRWGGVWAGLVLTGPSQHETVQRQQGGSPPGGRGRGAPGEDGPQGGELVCLGDGLSVGSSAGEALGGALWRMQGLRSLYSPQAVLFMASRCWLQFYGVWKASRLQMARSLLSELHLQQLAEWKLDFGACGLWT